MRIVCLSDTHGKHNLIQVPDGDILLHAGDFSGRGRLEEVKRFLDWFAALPHPHKVFIAGNHDFLAERQSQLFHSLIPDNCIYLENNAVEVAGLKIWGSPITPWFFDWAFNRHRGDEIRPYWDAIPNDVDILITHGPPNGILDRTASGQLVGCEELMVQIHRIKPVIHLFGHIHEAYGTAYVNEICFINGSNLNLAYQYVNKPVVVNEKGELR